MGFLQRIIAGGQTGVDTAALRAALRKGLAVGGWCPPDGCNEAGSIPANFGLRPTPEERSPDAPDVPRSLRTEWNVRDAEATLILLPGDGSMPTDRGTDWTRAVAERLGKPLFTALLGDAQAADAVRSWLEHVRPRVLNIAGPSEGTVPGIERAACDLLDAVFASFRI